MADGDDSKRVASQKTGTKGRTRIVIEKKEMIDETGVPEPVLRAGAETGETKRAAVDPDTGEIGNNQ